MAREPGDRIIPKLIPVIRDTIVATKRSLAGHEKEVRRQATQAVIDDAGREVADLFRPFVQQLLDADDGTMSDELRQHLIDAASGEHQLKAIGGLLMGPVSGALGTLISNELAPLVYRLVGAQPNLDLDPASAASAAARGIVAQADAADSVHQQGYNVGIFNTMLGLAQIPPDITLLWTLVNRNLMSEAQAEHWLHFAGYDKSVFTDLMALRHQLLSPADAALAVLRNNMTHDDGVRIAQQQGMTASDFEILIGNTGEPPGVMDMLAMLRRGIIDRSMLEKGILESRVRNEWIPAIEQMRYAPMTTADAIDASVQNHLSTGEARNIAQENGLLPAHFDALQQTAGSPLSKTEMLRLYRQNKVTADEVKQALRESRLKDKYIDHALELSVQLPPLFTVREMLTAGALTAEQATRLLLEDGYEDFVIKAIIQTAHKTKTVKTHELTEGMLSALYRETAINASDFRDQLKHLGYTEAEAAQIQAIDDWSVVKAARDSAISHIRTVFVSHKISDTEAQNQLHALNVPATMIDKIMVDWKLEQKSAVRLLTPAQIIGAWKLNLIDVAEALGKLVNLGYSGSDAGLLIEIANKGPLAAGGK